MRELDFDKLDGLVPAVVQDHRTGEVLMLAFMNKESWEVTLRSGTACYWSRSRGRLWKKGEQSGNLQIVREIRVDCDADSVLLKVEQVGGAACHTGYRSCFHRRVDGDALVTDGVRVSDPAALYGEAR